MLLSLIKDVPDRKHSDVKALQKSSFPTVMYGAGSYAKDVAGFLAKHNINIDHYSADKEFLNDQLINNTPVAALEDICTKYPDLNIVIGFSDYITAGKKLKKICPKAKAYFIDAPNQEGFFDFNYIKQNLSAFEQTYQWLEDQKSKDIFIAFINAKISGDPSGLYKYAELNQYFNDLIKLSDHETFIDSGAYDGDTVLRFVKAVNGKYKKIFALEPIEENQVKLKDSIERHKVRSVEIIEKGSWSQPAILRFSDEGNTSTVSADGGSKIPVDSIDNVTGKEATFIKMDIEGAELESLRGAEKTIELHKPKLAICAYHKPEDLITIPQFIKSLDNGYRLYLRHHQFMSWEMVLYALPA